MRILAVSDAHGNIVALRDVVAKHIDEIDVVVSAGDLAPYGNPAGCRRMLEALAAMCRDRGVPVIAVPGNMERLQDYDHPPEGVHVVHGSHAVVHGYSFMGVGGSPPTPFSTYFELSEEEIAHLLEKAWREAFASGPVILVSHSPPYGTKCDLARGSEHVGSRALRMFLEHNPVLLCICGHIHESRNIDRIGRTTIVNPGPLKNGFYAIIEVEEYNIKRVELRSL